ncbi:uncharacterized protein LOC143067296 [Mytilus galloprovincialis]|uniref:uncharacterized protein LOC143067296 n=1 Tax=Mytilus galloprovincialis TaxID=29158 RepID=UPI003F7B68EA
MALPRVQSSDSICDGGEPRRKGSDNLLDTADDLVDRLDGLADILAEIEDTFQKDDEDDNDSKRPNIFRRLKDGLDSARSLIACLKREKWRVNRRKMSVDMRMGELDDYKMHLKQDMTSLNTTVDDLALRLIQSENDNCDAQEALEELEIAKAEVEDELVDANKRIKKLNEDKDDLVTEIQSLRRLRSDSAVRRENAELRSEIEVLHEERHHLKAIIRDMEDYKTENNSQDGGSDILTVTDVNLNALKLKTKSKDVKSSPKNRKKVDGSIHFV